MSGSRSPWPPVPFLRREDVTPAMEQAVRQVAQVFPGTRIRLEGVLRPVRGGNGSPDAPQLRQDAPKTGDLQ